MVPPVPREGACRGTFFKGCPLATRAHAFPLPTIVDGGYERLSDFLGVDHELIFVKLEVVPHLLLDLLQPHQVGSDSMPESCTHMWEGQRHERGDNGTKVHLGRCSPGEPEKSTRMIGMTSRQRKVVNKYAE